MTPKLHFLTKTALPLVTLGPSIIFSFAEQKHPFVMDRTINEEPPLKNKPNMQPFVREEALQTRALTSVGSSDNGALCIFFFFFGLVIMDSVPLRKGVTSLANT
jgi:hypothetical protein